MRNFVKVGRTAELGPGSMVEVQARGHTLALANVDQTYYALEASCPADGTNLARYGHLQGNLLICPEDRTAYDVRTGSPQGEHQVEPLRRYAIRVEGNEIRVGPALSRP